MTQYLCIDLETGITEGYGRKGNPWLNPIIAIGLCQAKRTTTLYYTDTAACSKWWTYLQSIETLVGHNIKFDLLYLWKQPWLQDWIKQGGKIYDTQLAEYILTGQQAKFAALRKIAVEKYGCKEREKKMEKYWEQGIDTKDIPKELVLEDVTWDVLDTEAIYLQQLQKAKELGMTKLIELQNDALLATCEMEANGLKVNPEILRNNAKVLRKNLDDAKIELHTIVERYWK